MKSFRILQVVLLLWVVELEATSISQFLCPFRNLIVTSDDYLRLYFDGIEITDLPNANKSHIPDIVELPCTTRLIGTHGRAGVNLGPGGILASTDDEYVLTNTTWKCSNVSHIGWEEIDFDDSDWTSAVDQGRNGNSSTEFVPDISLNASWIWLRQWISGEQDFDMEVYCRKKLVPIFCTSSPCAFGGTCIEEPDGEYRCICIPGYTGQNCSAVINYCESNPCTNGATCLPIVNGYTCQCQPGYTGDNCEYVTNNCESSPCLNGGTCLNGINYFVCVCPAEWTGARCDALVSACDPNPCLNGGTCNYLGGESFSCSCQTSWTGVRCESTNYDESLVCGWTLTWSQYNASNGFTRLCYYSPDPEDIDGRSTTCRYMIRGIPLYDDYIGLLNAGGNFGCLVSQNYPEDIACTNDLSCADNYQQDVYIGMTGESARMMVCIRYPYEGQPGTE